jgi:probable phosphoglycerate mutase
MGAGSVRDVWLVRHGQTEWSRSGRHTSVTDVALTEAGEDEARALRGRLASERFALVLTSPRLRARRTAELAGFPDAQVDDDLAEWDYGELEGLTSDQIRQRIPDWTVWAQGGPGGEGVLEVAARIDRLVARLREVEGQVLCFGHGHALRVLGVRWLAEPVSLGGALALDTASVSVLGWEHGRPAIIHWND